MSFQRKKLANFPNQVTNSVFAHAAYPFGPEVKAWFMNCVRIFGDGVGVGAGEVVQAVRRRVRMRPPTFLYGGGGRFARISPSPALQDCRINQH
jgi:hypothetical protein